MAVWAVLTQRAGRTPPAYPSDWFSAQRAFPGQTVNQAAYLRALEWARVERSALRTSAGGPVWTEAGPFNVGGRITALAVVPGGTTVFAGSAAGGVFQSVDGGVSWDPVFDQVTSIGALALDPANPAVLYVGTGEANSAIDNYDGAGLFRTADGGQTWAYLGLEETRRIARVAVDPENPDRVFVAAMGAQYSTGLDRGLYRSENGGQSWTKVLFVNDSTGVCDVAINPAHPETVFCATWERIRRPTYRRVFGPGCGIWRSVDHGTTWTRLSGGLPAPSDDVGRIALAIAPSRPSMIYAQILGGPAFGLNGLGLYRSLDGGASWMKRDATGFATIFGGFGWYFGDMAVDPVNPEQIYCLGVDLVRSTNGGQNFSVITGNAHVDHHAIWIDPADPQRIYLGNDGGFFSSTVGGGIWSKSLDLPITQFYAGTVDPSNSSRLLGGAQDNGTTKTSGAPGAWSGVLGGDGFYCIVDPTNPNIVFAEWQNCCNRTGPRRFTNGGGGSTPPAPSGFSPSDRYNWNTPVVMDPNDHNVLLVGSHRVYKSTNNGVSYSATSHDLTTNNASATLPYSTISTLEIAQANSSTYYAGTDDGRVWRNRSAGAMGAWEDITAGLPVRWVTRVASSPADADVVYVTLSGYSLDEPVAHVYRSVDGGDNWSAIDGNLPDVPCNDLLEDPADPNRLYLATDVGVFTSRDLGGSWYPLGLGLPLVPVVDLALHPSSRTLVAITHGRSMWKLDLDETALAVDPPPAPAALSLSSPRPNPSRGHVTLSLELGHPAKARVEVFDSMGRRIATLVNGPLGAGSHRLSWDGRDARGAAASAGSYYVRASTEGRSRTRRVLLVH